MWFRIEASPHPHGGRRVISSKCTHCRMDMHSSWHERGTDRSSPIHGHLSTVFMVKREYMSVVVTNYDLTHGRSIYIYLCVCVCAYAFTEE